MSTHHFDANESEKDPVWEGNETIWHAWEPECDACGRPQSSIKRPKDQLLSCAGCIVAKYCSKECQRKDWSNGHKSQCHLYEANRKLSSAFAKSLGPGTLNDPTLTLTEKMMEWNFLNAHNHLVIAAAALKNDKTFAGTANIALLLSMADDRAGSKYEHRTFFIDRVVLLNRDASDTSARRVKDWHGSWSVADPEKTAERTDPHHFKLLVGWCEGVKGTQMWTYESYKAADHVLPPGFDLNRYVSHVNRGITHFHASFWPVPRNISEVDLESSEPPPGWKEYAARHRFLFAGLKGGGGILGCINADGTREPIYKFSNSGHFRRCAPGETDTEGPVEFQKAVVDPSKMVRLISKHLDIFEQGQHFEDDIERFSPALSLEDAKKISCPGRFKD